MKSKQTFIDYGTNIILQNEVVFTSTDKCKISQFAIIIEHFHCINERNSVLQALVFSILTVS